MSRIGWWGGSAPGEVVLPLRDGGDGGEGLAAQGSGFFLTTRELVMGTRADKTPVMVWMP